jgi:hypothetical protein
MAHWWIVAGGGGAAGTKGNASRKSSKPSHPPMCRVQIGKNSLEFGADGMTTFAALGSARDGPADYPPSTQYSRK